MSKKTELQKQKEIWYKKLKEEGFKDLENPNQEYGMITDSRPYALRGTDPHGVKTTKYHATQDYYYMAYHFLNSYKFDSELQKTMWEYHTEGLSVRDIAETLEKTGISTLKKSSIASILKSLEFKMKELYLLI